MKPAFPYYGGKAYHTENILPHFPEHHTFVELFGGSGALLLAKPPSRVEVFNDIDSGVTNFYAVLRDKGASEELIRRLRLTPYSREEYYTCLHTWRACPDPIEKARRWYFVQVASYNGRFGVGFSTSASASSCGKSSFVSSYQARINRIPDVANRFADVIVEHLDFRKCIAKYDTPNTLFYGDAPYVIDTRNKTSTYQHEMSNEDHADLVCLALSSKGMWVISGYAHDIYKPLEEAGWRKVQYPMVCRSSLRNPRRETSREETLYISPTGV